MLNENEAAQKREVTVLHPHTSNLKVTFRGNEVYSVIEKGITIVQGTYRYFYPWHRVVLFVYHNDDVAARKVIQGY